MLKEIKGIRRKNLYQKDIEIVEILVRGRKHNKCLIKFND